MIRQPFVFISHKFLSLRYSLRPWGKRDACLPVGRGVRGKRFRGSKHWYIYIGLFMLILLLSGCPKKIARIPSIEVPPVMDPMGKLLEAFSPAETLQAKASIRLDTVRKGEEFKFLLNGVVFYEKPDKLRILGYHPFGMGVFDALYRGGEFVLFSPLQNRAYTGEISEFGNLIAKANVRISAEKPEGSDVPNRIRIEMPEKETRLDVKLKEITVNQPLPNDAFQWVPPEGVEIKSLAQFLKGKKLE